MLLAYILLIVVMMAAGASLLNRGTVAMMGKLGGETIHRMHSSAEFIVAHHKVPPAWRHRLEKRLSGLRPEAAPSTGASKPASHKARAKAASLRQLSRLIEHFRKTSLVVDEEARRILVAELLQVYDEWSPLSWEEMNL